MKTKKGRRVIRTLSKKYQLTIPKKFGEDLGLEPPISVTVTEDPTSKCIIIEPLPLGHQDKKQTKEALIEACRVLGKKWAKRGVTQKDVEEAVQEFRKAS